jgi:hypothetical protein
MASVTFCIMNFRLYLFQKKEEGLFHITKDGLSFYLFVWWLRKLYKISQVRGKVLIFVSNACCSAESISSSYLFSMARVSTPCLVHFLQEKIKKEKKKRIESYNTSSCLVTWRKWKENKEKRRNF